MINEINYGETKMRHPNGITNFRERDVLFRVQKNKNCIF